MDIQKEAEQLINEIEKISEEIGWRLGTGTKQSDFLRAKELQKKRIDLILQSFEKVCREQRAAVMDHYYDSDNAGGTLYTISETPLLTDKQLITRASKKQVNEDYHLACQNCGTTKRPLHIIPLRNENHVVGLIHSCDKCNDELAGQRFDRKEKF